MRKVVLAVVVMISGLLLVSCSSANNDSSNDEKETNTSGPLIDPEHAIDERQEIEKMIEEQKDLLKLGFVTDDNLINNIQISRRVTFYEDDYDFSEDDRVSHSSFYTTKGSNPSIQYSGNAFVCEDGLDEWTADLEERQSFNHDDKEGYYGHIEYDASEIVVKYNEKCYSAHVSTDDDGYDDDDKRLLELMSKTFKTEAEGAYDPFYSRFTMDLEKIKFPSMNQDRVTLSGTHISYWEEKFDGNYSRIGGSYYVGEDYIDYEVTDNDKLYSDIEKKELKTDEGTPVIVYEDSISDHRLKYRWTDGTYNYLIEVNGEKTSLSDNDILAVIDSAMEDDRSFDNLDFFKGVHDAPNLGKDELELQEYFKVDE